MTSFAFVFGVLPLAIATGPGAGSQNAIGRAVVGGTLTATFLAIFFVPLFFVFVKRRFHLDWPVASPSLQPSPAERTHWAFGDFAGGLNLTYRPYQSAARGLWVARATN
jgi:hypothetical protein